MKGLLLELVIATAAIAVGATNDWENLAVNSINRLPARCYTVPLADATAAFTDELEPESPYFKSLNGEWKFSWAGNPALRPLDFFAVDFDDSTWVTIDVPSCVEMRGWGNPGYTNIRYPHKEAWPRILDRVTGNPDYNPVSSYRTTFAVPEAWEGRRTILRFEGVGSAFYVWVNGKRVGYAEDSKLPSEFDITEYLNAKEENLLCVEVYKWCDGSYLEDQDMFRFSGIFRDVSMWSMPEGGIWDFQVRAIPAEGGKSSTIAVDGLPAGAEWRLYDGREEVASSSKADRAGVCKVANAKLWSAEKPFLYTLVIRRGDDIRMRRVGFKLQQVVGNRFFINGQSVKLKGVNRHETNPDNGRTVSLADMITDIQMFKRFNIDTVRTCHYPDHRLWYDLCDRYGIYVIAEANVEAHEPGYGDKSIGRFSEWDHSIVERNERHVIFYRDNPSVIMWSMGNETGHGDCFRHAIAAAKKLDPSRVIHWERGNIDADIDSCMYPSVNWLEERGKLGDAHPNSYKMKDVGGWLFDEACHGEKPHIMCEYAHAMGNALGNFQEYWDVIYAHPSLIGGCIWDWVDQAVWKYADRVDPKTGCRERYLAYGGDFDEDPNDGPFCCNGVVDPLRRVSPKLVEVAQVYRNLIVRLVDGGFELENRFGFTSADEFNGVWRLKANGETVADGEFEPPAVKPLSRARFEVEALTDALMAADSEKETFVEFEFVTKSSSPWAESGWIVARDQLLVNAGRGTFAAEGVATNLVAMGVEELKDEVVFETGRTTAVFNRNSGTLKLLVMRGQTVLEDPADGITAGPRLSCVRAFTDNDWYLRKMCEQSGLTQLHYHPRSISVVSNQVFTSVEVTGTKSAGFTHDSTWTFAEDGSVTVDNRVATHGAMPENLPRLGLSLLLAPRLEHMRYYGRGPWENYVDRLTGSFIGIYESTVSDQFVDYVRPQANGSKCDVRWVEFLDKGGRGVRFTASEPMFIDASHYVWEDLELSRHINGQHRFRSPLVPRPNVCLDLDIRQTGLGGGSCGPLPLDKYRYKPETEIRWTLKMEAVRK